MFLEKKCFIGEVSKARRTFPPWETLLRQLSIERKYFLTVSGESFLINLTKLEVLTEDWACLIQKELDLVEGRVGSLLPKNVKIKSPILMSGEMGGTPELRHCLRCPNSLARWLTCKAVFTLPNWVWYPWLHTRSADTRQYTDAQGFAETEFALDLSWT